MFPDIQGRQTDSLWDTGAFRCLTRASVAEILQARGAQITPLGFDLFVFGIGSKALSATHKVEAKCKFQDGKERKIEAAIVDDSLPFEFIVGQDFIKAQLIAHVPLESQDGFQLWDTSTNPWQLMYDSRQDPEVTLPSSKVHTRDMAAAAISDEPLTPSPDVSAKPKKIGKKGYRKFAEIWNSLPDDDRRLIHTLATCKLSQTKVDQLNNLIQADTNTAPTMACSDGTNGNTAPPSQERLKVPTCDFPEYQDQLENLINEYADIFSSSGSDVGVSKGPSASIKLAQNKVVNLKNYRTPAKLKPILKELVQDLVDAGVIEPCDSNQFNSPCLLIPKKAEGNIKKGALYRLVVDYRELNKIIHNAVFPIPRIQDIFQQYKGCTVFSACDIRHAFYTVGIDEQSRHLTAFSCELGKFQFKFLPQGLKISPAVFQAQIEKDLKGLERTSPYIDDISIGDETPPKHLSTLRALFQRLRERGYKLKLNKCLFMRKQITHLGNLLSEKGLGIPPDKIEAVKEMKPPTTQSEIKSLLGFTNFLREQVPCYCDIVYPIHSLLANKVKKGDISDLWLPIHQEAFDELKRLLIESPGLAYPDHTKPFILWTDASQKAMSAVLMQKVSDNTPADQQNTIHNCRPVCYWSKSFKGSQRNWAPLVKEARAVFEAVRQFAHFITGCKVYLRCDHKPLTRFLHARTKNDMVNRWSILIQHHDIEFDWVCSEENVSDYLSRQCSARLFHKLEFKPDDDFPAFPMRQGNTTDQGTQVQMAATAHAVSPTCPDTELLVKNISHLSIEQMIEFQKQDNYCQRVIKSKRNFREQNGKFHVSDGLLYKQFYPKPGQIERLPSLALVIPRALILTVLVSTHKELQHPGQKRMYNALRPKVYWKRMQHHISNYVRGCSICQYRHLEEVKLPLNRVPPPKGPGLRLALDLWSGDGGLLFTAIDMHSQYPFAEPIPNKSASAVCEAFLNVLSYFRTPNEVVTDNGSEFVSQEFQDLLQKLHIEHIRIAPRSPQGNLVERFHRFLGEQYRLTHGLTDNADWWACVRAALTAYRKLPHTSSGESPLFLQTGQDATLAIDRLLPVKSRTLHDSDTDTPSLSYLRVAHAIARKNLCLQRKRSTAQTQGKVVDKPLTVGDRVFRKNMSSKRSKTDLKWLPGYRIVEFKTPFTAVIEHSKTKTKARINVRHLRWADPVSELVMNSELDVFPGESKLYFSAEDIKDLNWDAIENLPKPKSQVQDRIDQAIRDRSCDLTPQVNPHKKPTPSNKRTTRKPRYLNDYICSVIHRSPPSLTPTTRRSYYTSNQSLNYALFAEVFDPVTAAPIEDVDQRTCQTV